MYHRELLLRSNWKQWLLSEIKYYEHYADKKNLSAIEVAKIVKHD